MCKVRLYRPNGSEVESRPSESRLFRPPSDITATDDLHALTQNLQDALSREKVLEDKLVRVRTMISKNIGRSHTDMLRAFENIKEELMAEVVGGNMENAALEKVGLQMQLIWSKYDLQSKKEPISTKPFFVGDEREHQSYPKGCRNRKLPQSIGDGQDQYGAEAKGGRR